MKVYLISGPARNGKDTIGDFLEKDYKEMGYKVCRTQIAKYLKMYIKDYFGWDGSEETKPRELLQRLGTEDRKSTRLNSSHVAISYAVFCLKKKKKHKANR